MTQILHVINHLPYCQGTHSSLHMYQWHSAIILGDCDGGRNKETVTLCEWRQAMRYLCKLFGLSKTVEAVEQNLGESWSETFNSFTHLESSRDGSFLAREYSRHNEDDLTINSLPKMNCTMWSPWTDKPSHMLSTTTTSPLCRCSQGRFSRDPPI